jgi:uncharacterized ion transporter superfamily protein YfcC
MDKVSSNKSTAKKKWLRVPNTPALMLFVILIVGILTYVIPAGEFERVFDEATNRTLVVPDTFTTMEQTPVGIGGILSSVFEGLVKASEIIGFVFVVGGAFAIVQKSGAIDSGLGKLIKKFTGREYLLISILMIAFSIGGATFGMAEETLPFVTILVATSLSMGFDKVVGVAMILVGVYCGYSAGPLNPFNTGVAQGIAELPPFSGIGLRIALMVGSLVIAIHHTIRYCEKLKKDKKGIIVKDDEFTINDEEQFNMEMNSQRRLILIILVITISVLVFGVLKYGWYFSEISALFFAMSLVVGLILFKGNFEKFADEFIIGASGMAGAAILMGLSRAILVVAEQGHIMDTIVYYISIPLSNLNNVFAAWGMYIAQGFINFFIPSSSGQAVVVMPIMSALSDLLGVTRQVSVLAFQAGDGYWNMITPTHSVVMATLGLAGLSFNKWFKFALPLVIKWSLWIMAVLAFAVFTNWGPF